MIISIIVEAAGVVVPRLGEVRQLPCCAVWCVLLDTGATSAATNPAAGHYQLFRISERNTTRNSKVIKRRVKVWFV